MMSASSLANAVTEHTKTFTGQLLQPTDAGYEEARKVHNGLVDKRPALIARCRGVADIVEAVNLARTLNLEVAVRGGGHNVAGRATVDGGLMIDLSLMKGIHVDPRTRTARAQGGVTWGEFNRETQLHGLATTGGVVSSTGIAGLTLGGGIGWLMGKYGLALDNLTSVELVTADGRTLRASEDENADLFWAVRGGGGNFGIAASSRVSSAPGGTDDHRRSRLLSLARCPRRAEILPRGGRVGTRRPHAGRQSGWGTGRLGNKGGSDRGVSLRCTARWCSGNAPPQGIWPSCHGHDRPDELLRAQRDAR